MGKKLSEEVVLSDSDESMEDAPETTQVAGKKSQKESNSAPEKDATSSSSESESESESESNSSDESESEEKPQKKYVFVHVLNLACFFFFSLTNTLAFLSVQCGFSSVI